MAKIKWAGDLAGVLNVTRWGAGVWGSFSRGRKGVQTGSKVGPKWVPEVCGFLDSCPPQVDGQARPSLVPPAHRLLDFQRAVRSKGLVKSARPYRGVELHECARKRARDSGETGIGMRGVGKVL